MTPKNPDETDVEASPYITRREFGREIQGLRDKIDGIPEALRTEFIAQMNQSRPHGATMAAWVTLFALLGLAAIGALLYHINSGRELDRISQQVARDSDKTAINMRFELERANVAMQVEAIKTANAEYHRLQEAAQQQVWKQQNSVQERLENRIDNWDRDMRTRYFNRLDEVAEPATVTTPKNRKK